MSLAKERAWVEELEALPEGRRLERMLGAGRSVDRACQGGAGAAGPGIVPDPAAARTAVDRHRSRGAGLGAPQGRLVVMVRLNGISCVESSPEHLAKALVPSVVTTHVVGVGCVAKTLSNRSVLQMLN